MPGAPRSVPTVLVVEDDPLMGELLRVMLRDEFRVLTADTGRDGLALARGEPPAAVILDLILPDISGLEVLAALRADPRTADVPVIVVSAHLRHLPGLDRSQAVQVVDKPFSPLGLLGVVRSAVSRAV